MSNYLGKSNLSRGIRNNNPGNLRITADKWQGMVSLDKNTDKSFQQFIEMKYGVRAMLRDVVNDILKGKNTIRKLISEYAPPTENNTESYINGVSKKLGLTPDEKIKKIDAVFLMAIAKAIISHEVKASEKHLVTDSDIRKAISILGTFNTPKDLKIDTTVLNPLIALIPVLLFFYTWLTVSL
ncbi:virion protein [Flavobacteriaceae bacterium]